MRWSIWKTCSVLCSNSRGRAFILVSPRCCFKHHTENQAASKKLQGNSARHFYTYQLSRTLIRINFYNLIWTSANLHTSACLPPTHTRTHCGPVKSFTLSHTWQGNVLLFRSVENGLYYTAQRWPDAQESHYSLSFSPNLTGTLKTCRYQTPPFLTLSRFLSHCSPHVCHCIESLPLKES